MADEKMRVEILRIDGDIYINGTKKLFAVDFNDPPFAHPTFQEVEWLIGWAKIGLMSQGHTCNHTEITAFHDEKRSTEVKK